ncbi:MAG: hypothetical protein FXF47_04635 [Candidatus Mcinerneyibacterium aminivorans]|uniref:protein acetyllysine N-acetyltransferase n=1 Tax=Candidatus Mcinerneyibacterium aminivorans TaxID=2703815 RepID=A0A5D0ML73_9BACT|nr:MAG: hypothetical protein FXF47_04635 [Candidatus Mcinerneyibacterium aminivorans]
MDDKIKKLEDLLKNSTYTVALTGAGVSTDAGIPDFRGKNGIYKSKKYDPQKTFDYNYFKKDPSHFFKFSKELLTQIDELEPTKTHYFLAKLEEKNILKTLITQNIDNLHIKAGSKNIIHIHGTYNKGHCLKCNREYNFQWMKINLIEKEKLICECGGIVKPDVVFFGEPVKDIEKAFNEVKKADVLLILGSSLTVQPAAMFPLFSSATKIIINKGNIGIPEEEIDLFIKSDLNEAVSKINI